MSLENASLKEIIDRAKSLVDKRIIDIAPGVALNKNDKGAIGNLIQKYGFGIPVNNESAPDFKKEGIELKILPLVSFKKKSGYKIKERTKICSIDYNKIQTEAWKTSHAKAKLQRILFVFYIYDNNTPLNSKIQAFSLYELNNHTQDEAIFSTDWDIVHAKVWEGKAHELSETLFTYLSASTSGSGGAGSIVTQPIKTFSPNAKKRSFSLKPSYTKVLWELTQGIQFDVLSKKYDFISSDDIESLLLKSLNRFEGRSIYDVAKEFNIKISNSKDFASRILRRSLGFKGKNKPIKEIEQLGLTVKAIPFRPSDKRPWEAMSFPFQPLNDIKEEENFEESNLYNQLNGIIIMPVYRISQKTSDKNKIIGKPFIWRPNEGELKIIKAEWEKYRSFIINGIKVDKIPAKTKTGFKRKSNLPKESETEIIHMRPHGADGKDIDDSIDGIEITKHCFWLNKKFLQKLLLMNS